MNRIYIIIAIMTAGSAVFAFAPEMLSHGASWLHWLTILVSGTHITEELGHAIHPRTAKVVG